MLVCKYVLKINYILYSFTKGKLYLYMFLLLRVLTVKSNSQISPTTPPPAKKGKKHLTPFNRLLFVYHLLLTVILVTFSESRS